MDNIPDGSKDPQSTLWTNINGLGFVEFRITPAIKFLKWGAVDPSLDGRDLPFEDVDEQILF